jgi:hypothetical protein
MKSFLVVSRYNEDVSWVPVLTSNYVIYNKGTALSDDYNQIQVPNFGGNQIDIFRYIHDNYDNLPDLIAFTQGNPFDHCLPERFNQLIYNDCYTFLFGDANYPNGDYYETNNSWYIYADFNMERPPSKFESFDDYMHFIFDDYTSIPFLQFPPGSQLIVEKKQCLFYSKSFWKKLMSVFCDVEGMNGGREAHIVERSIQLIFNNVYKEKQ